MRATFLLGVSVTLLLASCSEAAYFVRIPGVRVRANPSWPRGYDDGTWFEVTDVSFGITREMKDSGEKGGTYDINIGVGELLPVSFTKSLDGASPILAQFATNGNTCGTAELHFVDTTRTTGTHVGTRYKLDRAFVKDWSMNMNAMGSVDEKFSLYFNKIAFNVFYMDGDGGALSGIYSWDDIDNTKWDTHGLTRPSNRGLRTP